MSSDSGEKTLSVKRLLKAGIEPPDTETLQCPRCESINTKFCYYNNYNLSQPRYFCKSCRRYWTRGGTLRNVPVGGGTRKSSAVKRLRATSSSSSTTAIVTVPAPSSSSTLTHNDHVVSEMHVLNQEMGQQVNELNLNQAVSMEGPMVGVTGEFGLGLGVRGLGFEMSPWDWSLGEVAGDIVESGCNTTGGGGGGACWQVDNGEYYCWSDLAMSTPGNGVK